MVQSFGWEWKENYPNFWAPLSKTGVKELQSKLQENHCDRALYTEPASKHPITQTRQTHPPAAWEELYKYGGITKHIMLAAILNEPITAIAFNSTFKPTLTTDATKRRALEQTWSHKQKDA